MSKMLNVKALTELLSSNRDERLCKLWYIMTVNGTLLAHSQPVRINDLRRQAALAALSWQRYDGSHAHNESEEEFDHYARPGVDQSPLRTLVIESDSSNVIIRKIQPSLLLVLEGGVPPGRVRPVSRFTIESEDGTAKSVDADGQNLEISGTVGGALQRQRSKLDALAAVIIGDFEHSGFRMPDDPSLTIF
jgi:hypothetical protein